MGAIVLVVGVVVLGAVIAVVVAARSRSRRNAGPVPGHPWPGPHAPQSGYQQQAYPLAQPPYPPVSHQGYPAPPGQQPASLAPNPYKQPPPHQGQ
ncbi:hypothetical protein ACFXDP_16330 [Streptomyces sp. NPDC059374]|uniref:hypothetical protein n=1 Tax=Streptomyces sp. NPDC059374 TaxID=3346814 RepID=UPI00367B614C